MNNPKFGEALARTMDRLDKLEARGDLDGCELQEVLVIVAFTKPATDRDEIEDDAIESLIFVDGSTQVPFIQGGILALALDTAVTQT
jgi:hypothetical protein